MNNKKETDQNEYQNTVFEHVILELSKCRDRMQGFEKALTDMKNAHDDTRRLVDELSSSTQELLCILHACKGGLTVLGWLGKCMKWLTIVATGIAALYTILHAFVGGHWAAR